MNDYFLEAKNIYKFFGNVKALQNVSFKIRLGQIYCLAGENGSGKTTLIKVISGTHAPDRGTIILNGESYKHITPIQSIKTGIQVIYQDFSVFNNLTVAENITISHNFLNKKRFVNEKKNAQIAKNILEEIGVDIDVKKIVDDIPVAQKQIVAICRALVENAKVVIMDEPTSALNNKEIESLYKIIRGLKDKNVAVVFVSHKFAEIFAVSEYITVLRNGQNVIEGPLENFNKTKLYHYMTGKDTKDVKSDLIQDKSQIILQVENLTRKNIFQNINFNLYKNEVLGITGLLGSGRTELAEALFGLASQDSGNVYLFGKKIRIKYPGDAVKLGIGYVPEDRLKQGLFLGIEINRNIASSILDALSNKIGFLKKGRIKNVVRQQADYLNIKTASLDASVMTLSGGNQQRVVLAKWLAVNPKLLILNCPTVGVDVGSKDDIHDIILNFAKKGIGVILISDDLPEILKISNRVLIMNNGMIVKEFETKTVQENELHYWLTKE